MDMNESRTLTMNARGRLVEAESPFLTFQLSWVAYVRDLMDFLWRALLCVLVTFLVAFGLDRFAHIYATAWLPVLGLAVALAWTAYSVAFTRSVRLFTDEVGVWMQAGVFPWEKGVSGVQWRDVGQAGFTQGFLAWALRSYDIRVTHRFTAGSELILRNVRYGNLAVMHVNSVMAELQGRALRS